MHKKKLVKCTAYLQCQYFLIVSQMQVAAVPRFIVTLSCDKTCEKRHKMRQNVLESVKGTIKKGAQTTLAHVLFVGKHIQVNGRPYAVAQQMHQKTPSPPKIWRVTLQRCE